ncbi:MAG: anti-sigma factor antagonist [Chloroflexota bacterium]|jgi:anti-anti-sigma factor
MIFEATLEMRGPIALITLSGELDAATAPQFRERIEEAAAHKARRLVLIMNDLTYMASAGLRVMIFAKQTLGPDADLYIIGAHDSVVETIEMTGFHQGVILRDSYDPSEIETL